MRLPWRSNGRLPAQTGTFGPLEQRVLEAVWDRHAPVTVRDLHASFPDIAYTTVMTTLDRLHAKGLLDRSKEGRAYAYTPKLTREALASLRMKDALDVLFDGGIDRRQPALSMLVDTVSAVDRDALDELERLIREKRRSSRSER